MTLLTPLYRPDSERRKGQGSTTVQSFPTDSYPGEPSSTQSSALVLDSALSHKGWGNPAKQNGALAQSAVSVGLTLQGHHATLPRGDTPAAGGALERARGGALRASRRWGSRKSRPLSLGKYCGGACALRLRPLPGDQRDFGARGRRDSETRR